MGASLWQQFQASEYVGSDWAQPSPSLDIRTHSDRAGVDPFREPHVAVAVYEFPSTVEAVFVVRRQAAARPGVKRERVAKASRAEMTEEDRRRSFFRAKRELRWRLLSMQADRLLTLTTRGPVPRGLLLEAWEKLRRRLLRLWPDFQAVVVPERHNGQGANHGGWHLHVALNKFRNVSVLRYEWHKALRAVGHDPWEGTPGNVDIQKAQFRHPAKLARYLSKYLAKGEADQVVGSKRFTSCGEIAPPKKSHEVFPAGFGLAPAVQWVRQVHGKRWRFFFHFFNQAGDECLWLSTA